MVLPVPSEMTATVGQILTAAEWNANVQQAVNFLLNKPKARLYISGSYSLGNSTWGQITGGTSTFTVDYDPYGMWNPTYNVLYLPYGGIWRVRGRLVFPTNGTGVRGVGFAWDAATQDQNRYTVVGANSANITSIEANSEGYLPGGGASYIRLMGFQSSGAAMALEAQGEFSVEFLGSS